MIYFKSQSGKVFAYETQDERDQFGAPDLVEMTQSEIDEHLNPAPVLYIPEKVTMRQARLALLGAGLLDSVEATINALPEPPQTAARIEWDYASEVHRSSEFVGMLGAALELDEQALDNLFLKAVEL